MWTHGDRLALKEVTFCVYACLYVYVQVLEYMNVYVCGGQRTTCGVVPEDLPVSLIEIGCLTHETGSPVSPGEPPLSVSRVLDIQACVSCLFFL